MNFSISQPHIVTDHSNESSTENGLIYKNISSFMDGQKTTQALPLHLERQSHHLDITTINANIWDKDGGCAYKDQILETSHLSMLFGQIHEHPLQAPNNTASWNPTSSLSKPSLGLAREHKRECQGKEGNPSQPYYFSLKRKSIS